MGKCYSWWCVRLNKEWQSKALPDITWKDFKDRMNNFAMLYWHNIDYWKNAWFDNKIKPEVMLCIARADSDLWKQLKSKNNFGNVWNNDRWNVVHYDTQQAWINAIARVLHNKYLWKKQTIWDLTPSGSCSIDCDKFYATSKENWNNNVLNCLSHIHNKKINEDFNFRIKL